MQVPTLSEHPYISKLAARFDAYCQRHSSRQAAAYRLLVEFYHPKASVEGDSDCAEQYLDFLRDRLTGRAPITAELHAHLCKEFKLPLAEMTPLLSAYIEARKLHDGRRFAAPVKLNFDEVPSAQLVDLESFSSIMVDAIDGQRLRGNFSEATANALHAIQFLIEQPDASRTHYERAAKIAWTAYRAMSIANERLNTSELSPAIIAFDAQRNALGRDRCYRYMREHVKMNLAFNRDLLAPAELLNTMTTGSRYVKALSRVRVLHAAYAKRPSDAFVTLGISPWSTTSDQNFHVAQLHARTIDLHEFIETTKRYVEFEKDVRKRADHVACYAVPIATALMELRRFEEAIDYLTSIRVHLGRGAAKLRTAELKLREAEAHAQLARISPDSRASSRLVAFNLGENASRDIKTSGNFVLIGRVAGLLSSVAAR